MAAGLRDVSWSVAETRALAAKAARGGGAPPGQAERFGVAAAHHLAEKRAPEDLLRALEALPEGPILDYPLALDHAVCAAARGEAALSSVRPDDLLRSYVETLAFDARISTEETRGPMLKVDVRKPRPRRPVQRIDGCAALIARMEQLAKATFVPDSASSRVGGAGAGLTDND